MLRATKISDAGIHVLYGKPVPTVVPLFYRFSLEIIINHDKQSQTDSHYGAIWIGLTPFVTLYFIKWP